MASKTVTLETECEFDVFCGDCGQVLDADFDRSGTLRVDPCQTCMEKAAEDARED